MGECSGGVQPWCAGQGVPTSLWFRRLFSRGAGFEAHNLQEVGMATSVIRKLKF